jgi:hypothetical protein
VCAGRIRLPRISDGVLQRRWAVNGKPPSLIAMNSMLALLHADVNHSQTR